MHTAEGARLHPGCRQWFWPRVSSAPSEIHRAGGLCKVPGHTHTRAASTATEPTASEPRPSRPICLLVARAQLAGRFVRGGGRGPGLGAPAVHTSTWAGLLRDRMRGQQPAPGWAGRWTAARGQGRQGGSASGVSLHLPAAGRPSAQLPACGLTAGGVWGGAAPCSAAGRCHRGGPAARGQPGGWAGLRGERCSRLRLQGENERSRAPGVR